MTHPRKFVDEFHDKDAVVLEPSGESMTYGQLESRANQAAHLFRKCGVRTGEKVAFCLDNVIAVFEFAWGAQRAGAYYVPISSKLTPAELRYIVEDSGAKVLLTSDDIAATLDDTLSDIPGLSLFTTGPEINDFQSWRCSLDAQLEIAIADEARGSVMFYSSGTTGKPKGVVPPAPNNEPVDGPEMLPQLIGRLLKADSDSIYLCPAPLYHAAPLSWSMAMHRLGATTIILEKFDPELVLDVISRRKVTHGQFVPTHFIRMLKLPDQIRSAFDVTSLQAVVHAAAPCPVPVKEQMIDWWGAIIDEYYAGSESNGLTYIPAKEWLTHKGSVGRAAMGQIHICAEDGHELPPRQDGQIYFSGGPQFSYHNDQTKTEESRNNAGWSSIGDIGWQDEEGYLYLTDRKSYMIISGGVNIYPQEIENLLVTHPQVADVAVIGGPHSEMGEQVVAIVQPADSATAGPELEVELTKFCRTHLSGVKVPRLFDFRSELPRHPTGKLFKRLLRDEYWNALNS